MTGSPRVVFDRMVYVQALMAAACYERARREAINLYVEDRILAEVRDVLGRPRLRAKVSRLSIDVVDVFLDDVSRSATRIEIVPIVE